MNKVIIARRHRRNEAQIKKVIAPLGVWIMHNMMRAFYMFVEAKYSARSILEALPKLVLSSKQAEIM